MSAINKTTNIYAEAIGPKLYERTPKAVLAALVVSLLTGGGDFFPGVEERMLKEWQTLHEQGIVPQKPVKI